MKCQVCKKQEAKANSIICSDLCNEIRLMINRLSDKYTPTPGCKNCHSDLMNGCTKKCQSEFELAHEFIKDLYLLIRIKL